MTLRTKTALETNIAAAFPTRISNHRTLEKALLQDLVDSVLNAQSTTKTADYTVIITTDSGKVFDIATDAKTFTLPGIAIGNNFGFVNNGADAAVLVKISPNASDGITYAGSETDNKALQNTKATAIRGDYAKIAAFTAVVTWQVTDIRGVWAKEG